MIALALARLRTARERKQSDAALIAGLSRNTVYRLEKGDPGVALGQVLRHLEAIAPGSTLLALLNEGRQVAARKKLGSAAYPIIQPAPGRYVSVRGESVGPA
jgi:transcriptional regulator with XRE-family HTH domain